MFRVVLVCEFTDVCGIAIWGSRRNWNQSPLSGDVTVIERMHVAAGARQVPAPHPQQRITVDIRLQYDQTSTLRAETSFKLL
jgi:hypothetical protein